VAEHVGIPEDTPRYRPAGWPVLADEPLLLWDTNLCIGCLRCVRMCSDVRKVDALGFVLNEHGDPIVGLRAPTFRKSGCRFCLSCVEVCPTGALRLKDEESRVDGRRVTRCVAACPAGMDIPRYLREVRRGEFARADAVIREASPFPRVLGQVCFHPCESRCSRGDLSEPVAICALKRAAVEHTTAATWKSHLKAAAPSGKDIAVVGAGPAGLTAAWFLTLKGHGVVVFDAAPSPGGWLRDGIPPYRLAPEALDADIGEIVELGVRLHMGTEVGKDVALETIRDEHDAVFVAAGARRDKLLPCDGTDLEGVESGLAMLQRVAAGDNGQAALAGQRVVVVGGGNVAIDVARTALRLGPDAVHLYCLEERAEMPAHGWEVAEAEREGVVFHPGWGPTRIAGEGKVDGVDFRKCVSVFDDAGRFAPQLDDDVRVFQEADRVLVAIGQEPALGFLEGPALTDAGYIAVDPESMQTSMEGVFAGGEVVSGPASVVEAIGHGRRVASAVDRFLGGDGNIYFSLLDRTAPDTELGRLEGSADLERTPVPRLAPGDAVGCFAHVEESYQPAQATLEAGRCLGCDLRLSISPVPLPPQPWLEFTADNVATVPESEGVFQLLDESRVVYAIQGVANLRQALSEIDASITKARFFLFDEDPMYSKKESELIQQYLQQHGCLPPGEGEDDLDDLF
jgi:NADPH-dependent glutamate synthase beta subunit-like oxidoreductase